MTNLSIDLLNRKDSTTTNALISQLSNSRQFKNLSEREGHLIAIRDQEDDEKLQAGINQAITDGVLNRITPEPYKDIYVDGKTPDEVSDEMMNEVLDESSSQSFVIVLCGLSGTGKGTTVSKVKHVLETKHNRNVCCWSNGNIFRSLALLASTHCENSQEPVEKVLTMDNITEWMSMLQFEKDADKWDTTIKGMGLHYKVNDVQNTLLKSPAVSKILPTVAKATQGQVVLYASDAISKMVQGEKDLVVLLEGRMQTVNYVTSPYRFVLKLKNQEVIGQRRAAQRIMGSVLSKLSEDTSEEMIQKLIQASLDEFMKEITDKP